MGLFNQTFADDGQPIYFPANWKEGKNSSQQYEQWKTTSEFFVYSNSIQSLAAALFIFILVVLILSIRELLKINKLADDDRVKMEYKKYLKTQFIVSLGFMALMCIGLLILMMSQEWTRVIMYKGFALACIVYVLYRVYQAFGPTLKRTIRRIKNKYKKKEQSRHAN